jgi:hypothetical protein
VSSSRHSGQAKPATNALRSAEHAGVVQRLGRRHTLPQMRVRLLLPASNPRACARARRTSESAQVSAEERVYKDRPCGRVAWPGRRPWRAAPPRRGLSVRLRLIPVDDHPLPGIVPDGRLGPELPPPVSPSARIYGNASYQPGHSQPGRYGPCDRLAVYSHNVWRGAACPPTDMNADPRFVNLATFTCAPARLRSTEATPSASRGRTSTGTGVLLVVRPIRAQTSAGHVVTRRVGRPTRRSCFPRRCGGKVGRSAA